MENQNLQKWIFNLISKSLTNNRQYFYKITDQADRIIVWLVGFSISSIALSISNYFEVNKVISNLSHYIIIFGCLTIIFGILYRIFLYLAHVLELNIFLAFEGYIEGYNNPPNIHFGRQINNYNTYQDIISFIKEDFDVDIEQIDTAHLSKE